VQPEHERVGAGGIVAGGEPDRESARLAGDDDLVRALEGGAREAAPGGGARVVDVGEPIERLVARLVLMGVTRVALGELLRGVARPGVGRGDLGLRCAARRRHGERDDDGEGAPLRPHCGRA
jgi:hypothetical protein